MTASLHAGYDTGYLTKATGVSRTSVDYYTGEAGEPPGYWRGAGDAGKVSAAVIRRLYHQDIGPDGQVLARRPPGEVPGRGRLPGSADRGGDQAAG